MCKNKSCICHSTDQVLLERSFLSIWREAFSIEEEAKLEIAERDRKS